MKTLFLVVVPLNKFPFSCKKECVSLPMITAHADASGPKEDGWETGGTSFWAPNGQPLETN